MKKENVLNAVSTCMIAVGFSVIGAAVGTCIEYYENKKRIKALNDCVMLGNAAISYMHELIDDKSKKCNELEAKASDLQRRLDYIE